MARRKVFLLRIQIDVHSVYCREGRLCHGGNIALRVATLGSTSVTAPVHPSFPMHFREKFAFEKVIDCVTSLAEVQEHLSREPLRMELVQWPRNRSGKPIVVAYFRTKLSSLLFPVLLRGDAADDAGVRLLMEPTDEFAGDAAPKVDVSTRTILEETTRARCLLTRLSDGEEEEEGSDARGRRCWTGCRCPSNDRSRRKHGTKHCSPPPPSPPLRDSISCRDCCICNCYSVYFDPKSYYVDRSHSCSCMKPRCIRDEMERLSPYRQLFYDNLEHFYRQLRERKPSSRNFP